MSKLSEIAVEVVDPAAAANAQALLREIESSLQQLIETGESSRIDLGSLPLGPADYTLLDSVLGRGEVTASVDSLGVSEVYETAIAGVWRVEHYNSEETLVAEFIDVARCPELLQTPVEDLKDSLSLLAKVTAQSAKGSDDER